MSPLPRGMMGRLLEVVLASRTARTHALDERMAALFLGGRGLGTALLAGRLLRLRDPRESLPRGRSAFARKPARHQHLASERGADPGLPQNAIVQQSGADTELTSAMLIDAVHIVEDQPQIVRHGSTAVVSPEVVVIAALPLRSPGSDANVQVRGVSPRVLAVRDNVRVTAGRLFETGLSEIVVGKNAAAAYALDLGATVRIGPGTWKVVGLFDAGGSAFDSEIWTDADALNVNYQRPPGVFQSVTVRLRSPDDFDAFKKTVEADPRLHVQAIRERAYYEGQSCRSTACCWTHSCLRSRWRVSTSPIRSCATCSSRSSDISSPARPLKGPTSTSGTTGTVPTRGLTSA